MEVIYTYKRVVCVCLCCLFAFYRPHDICPLCGAASEWPRAGSAVVACLRPRAPRGRKHAQAEHVCACGTTSQRKNRCADAISKTKPYARACCRIRNCRDFQKKGKRKPTCHFPSSVYSLPSLEVFTFRIVLNRILHKSSLLAPMESRRTRRPTFTAEQSHLQLQILISYFKQNYWQEETSYLIFGRSRPWSASTL